METTSCEDYIRTWIDGQKLCKNCGLAESAHAAHAVEKYYNSSVTPAAKKIAVLQEAEAKKAEAALQASYVEHVIDSNPPWKVGMIVDGRDGNSTFECEIMQVNIEDESCDVKWKCDGSITKRLPYCALFGRVV